MPKRWKKVLPALQTKEKFLSVLTKKVLRAVSTDSFLITKTFVLVRFMIR
ncbi:hypothetical protein GHI93_00385 [Lactococcus hircilactis]|uniref:Uncharacterized protein n=1 Tax=Lactococcus hircilactis TaxID=1494462 RepID=A0A7X2D0H8_9LACT|nr:hypothetical protein [Lactococcus hircilactis]